MSGRYALGAGAALAAITALGGACSGPEDPFTSGSASATVTGIVTTSSGTPIPAASVHIACGGGGTPVSVSADSTGHYVTNLDTDSDPFSGNSGRLLCHFTEPAAGPARIRIDTALSFVRGPVFVPLQFVDLHER